ncbi:high mobility group protein D-like [Manduca sexta]|uniref:high mobility group protein D-like n=1 Tax=Manduca sexta TaxID=7130 RepID=UPI001890987C|nr:high mobility group protein D-like [Manduca sexta]
MSDKPKRPMSAYLLWLNSARDKIKSEHPGLKVTEIAKKASEIWRGMEDKSEWEAMAAKAKEQYTADLEFYNANGGDGGEEKKKRKPQKRGKKTKSAPAAKSRKKKQESEDEDDAEEDNESD